MMEHLQVRSQSAGWPTGRSDGGRKEGRAPGKKATATVAVAADRRDALTHCRFDRPTDRLTGQAVGKNALLPTMRCKHAVASSSLHSRAAISTLERPTLNCW